MLQTIKGIRVSLGFTQEEMANLLGITRNYLALMETNKRKTPDELLHKASALSDANSVTNRNVDYWKNRAIKAEARFDNLRLAIRNFNKVIENLEGAL